jgi:hypothetical protein
MLILIPAVIGLVTRLFRRRRNRGSATPAAEAGQP